MLDPCEWRKSDPDPDEWSIWETACGASHLFDEGGPVDNSHRFCPYCGGRLVTAGDDGGGDG